MLRRQTTHSLTRTTTSVELASTRRQTTYTTEYEEFMAETSASQAETKAAVAIAVGLDDEARAAFEGQSSDLIANIDALSKTVGCGGEGRCGEPSRYLAEQVRLTVS